MGTTVKIFGERNCGTNALTWMVRENSSSIVLPGGEFDLDPHAARCAWEGRETLDRERFIDELYKAVPDRLSWKHCATRFASASNFKQTLVLFCVRHPASWLVGLFRNPYHILINKPANIEEFLSCQWKTVARERLGEASFHPLDLYNEKLASYSVFSKRLHAAGIPNVFVRHEDLLFSAKQVFDSIQSQLNKPRKIFRSRFTSTKHRAPHDPNCRDYPSLDIGMPMFLIKRYYAKEMWREPLRGLEGTINRRVRWDLMRSFEYFPI
jgi:hypothetical protein